MGFYRKGSTTFSFQFMFWLATCGVIFSSSAGALVDTVGSPRDALIIVAKEMRDCNQSEIEAMERSSSSSAKWKQVKFLLSLGACGRPYRLENAIAIARAGAEEGIPEMQYFLASLLLDEAPSKKDAQSAYKLLKTSLDGGYANAGYVLCDIYASGYYEAPSPSTAYPYCKKAAELGDPYAQFQLGLWHFEGKLFSRDWQKAKHYLEPSRFLESRYYLGVIANESDSFAGDKAAREYFEVFVRHEDGSEPDMAGHAYAMLGYYHLYGKGTAVDREKAVSNFKIGAKRYGNSSAFDFMGYCLQHGYGIKKHVGSAKVWYREAAKLGHKDAQIALGELLLTDENHNEEGIHWLSRAGEQGDQRDQRALVTLGVYYTKVREYEKSIQIFKSLAEADHAYGQFMFAWHHLYGHGTNANAAIAHEWLLKAFQAGEPTAIKYIAAQLETGNGVRRDLASAADFYAKAVEHGYDQGRSDIGRVCEKIYSFNREVVNGDDTGTFITSSHCSAQKLSESMQRSNTIRHNKGESDLASILFAGAAVLATAYIADHLSDDQSRSSNQEPRVNNTALQACLDRAQQQIVQCWTMMDECDVIGCDYVYKCEGGSRGRACERAHTVHSSNLDDIYCDSLNPKNWSYESKLAVAYSMCGQK